jgi:hypothetical protein
MLVNFCVTMLWLEDFCNFNSFCVIPFTLQVFNQTTETAIQADTSLNSKETLRIKLSDQEVILIFDVKFFQRRIVLCLVFLNQEMKWNLGQELSHQKNSLFLIVNQGDLDQLILRLLVIRHLVS